MPVRVLFLTMLAIKEPDHVVRMPLRRLCKKANMTPEVCLAALKTLKEPDKLSLDDQPFEGKRVEEVEGGWLVLNGDFYQKEIQRLLLRMKKTQWQREERERQRLEAMTEPERERYLAAKAEGKEKVRKPRGLRAAKAEGEIAGRREGVSEGLAQAQAEVAAAPAGGNGSLPPPESVTVVAPAREPVSMDVAIAAKREKDRLAREAAAEAALEGKGDVAAVTGSAL